MSSDFNEDKTQTTVVISPGTLINHYKVTNKIGAGGMGEVYLATDTNLDREVALKFLPSNLIANDELKSRFTREAKAVAKLNHPNIITIYEVGEFNERPYFAMEYVPGNTLRHFVKEKPQSNSFLIELGIQLCQGLAEAHRSGIIHRDIKTANIIVDEKHRLRILDFGLAAMTGSEELTKTGSTLGTVAYMSPEQVSGRVVDQRSDLFSFGVVFYELLTGQNPFKKDNDGATLQAIMQEAPLPLARYKSDLSETVQQIIDKLLDKNLELRYQTAEGVIADLKRLQYDSQQTTGSVAINSTDDKSIVVVPFSNMSADTDNEYFSDGLTEEIITDLSGISDLRVISRASALLLKGTTKDAPQIGKELNVRYILTGSVRKAGNNVRITSQLVDAVTNQQVWADKYRGVLEDIFEIQEEVSQAIVKNLQLKLTSAEEKKINEHPIKDPKAYEYYLRARQEIQSWSHDGFQKGEKYLLHALELAGDNSLIYAELAKVHFQYMNTGIKQIEHLSVVNEYLEKAFALNPDNPQAHLVNGLIEQSLQGNKYNGIMHFKKVLEIDPNNVETMTWLALEYAIINETGRARSMITKIINIDPLRLSGKSTLSFIELMDGNFDKLIKNSRELYEVAPESNFNCLRLAHALTYTKQLEEAKIYIDKLTAESYYEQMVKALYYSALGDKEKTYQYLTKDAIDTSLRDAQYSLYISWTYFNLGENERGMEILENAVSNGFYNYSFLLHHDHLIEDVRSTERFKALIERMKKEQAELLASIE